MELKRISSLSSKKKEIMQFLQITWLVTFIFSFLFFSPILFVYCLFFSENLLLRILAIIYLCWMVYDSDTRHKGRGIGWLWLRDKCRFNTAKEYFPVDLIKTVDLPPDRNYLFAAFPHGTMCFGVIFNFVSFSSKFWKLYPRILPTVLNLSYMYNFPLARELSLFYGTASASAKCLKELLSTSNDLGDPINADGFTSRAAVLVVGGIREQMYSSPDEYRLVVKSRKGFVKNAIINGAALVPVFSFGEVDLYYQPPSLPGSRRRAIQEFTKRYLGVPLVTFRGAFGLIPKRKPINTVIGGPIEVIKDENPTEEYINQVHEKFIDALVDLFETHKSKYVDDHENRHLILE